MTRTIDGTATHQGGEHSMEKWTDELAGGLRKIFLAGVGAVATVSEKTGEVVNDLVKKGELTMDQGRKLTEEIKQSIKEQCAQATDGADDQESLLTKLDTLTPEERAALKARLEAIDRETESIG
jgi:polyhydroxyalkanoate synthesis regulator phasin